MQADETNYAANEVPGPEPMVIDKQSPSVRELNVQNIGLSPKIQAIGILTNDQSFLQADYR